MPTSTSNPNDLSPQDLEVLGAGDDAAGSLFMAKLYGPIDHRLRIEFMLLDEDDPTTARGVKPRWKYVSIKTTRDDEAATHHTLSIPALVDTYAADDFICDHCFTLHQRAVNGRLLSNFDGSTLEELVTYLAGSRDFLVKKVIDWARKQCDIQQVGNTLYQTQRSSDIQSATVQDVDDEFDYSLKGSQPWKQSSCASHEKHMALQVNFDHIAIDRIVRMAAMQAYEHLDKYDPGFEVLQDDLIASIQPAHSNPLEQLLRLTEEGRSQLMSDIDAISEKLLKTRFEHTSNNLRRKISAKHLESHLLPLQIRHIVTLLQLTENTASAHRSKYWKQVLEPPYIFKNLVEAEERDDD